MSVNKTSAVGDEPIDVLIALHPKFDLLDLTGPMKVFTTAAHDFNDECKYHLPSHVCGGVCSTLADPTPAPQPARPLRLPLSEMSPRFSLARVPLSAPRSPSRRPTTASRTLTFSSSSAATRRRSSRPMPSPSVSSTTLPSSRSATPVGSAPSSPSRVVPSSSPARASSLASRPPATPTT